MDGPRQSSYNAFLKSNWDIGKGSTPQSPEETSDTEQNTALPKAITGPALPGLIRTCFPPLHVRVHIHTNIHTQAHIGLSLSTLFKIIILFKEEAWKAI